MNNYLWCGTILIAALIISGKGSFAQMDGLFGLAAVVGGIMLLYGAWREFRGKSWFAK